jgi:hypothetical protein
MQVPALVPSLNCMRRPIRHPQSIGGDAEDQPAALRRLRAKIRPTRSTGSQPRSAHADPLLGEAQAAAPDGRLRRAPDATRLGRCFRAAAGPQLGWRPTVRAGKHWFLPLYYWLPLPVSAGHMELGDAVVVLLRQTCRCSRKRRARIMVPPARSTITALARYCWRRSTHRRPPAPRAASPTAQPARRGACQLGLIAFPSVAGARRAAGATAIVVGPVAGAMAYCCWRALRSGHAGAKHSRRGQSRRGAIARWYADS